MLVHHVVLLTAENASAYTYSLSTMRRDAVCCALQDATTQQQQVQLHVVSDAFTLCYVASMYAYIARYMYLRICMQYC
jgi:alpha-D-ribose 1-methylphosphonate 5-triphosphate synthase subunit PhnG